jgi:nucleoid DNA-binding protein
MGYRRWAGLLGLAGLLLAMSADAQAPARKETLKESIAKSVKMEEAAVAKVLAALGPAVRAQLSSGQQVELPGLGVFRVVRVPEHKDLVNGRPATIAGKNYVEFLAGGDLANAANAPGAQPARTVGAYDFVVNPRAAPSTKVPNTRAPSTRVR